MTTALITPDMTDAEILAIPDEVLIRNAREAVRSMKRSARKMFYGIASGAKLVECHGEPIDGVEYFIGEDGVRCVWVETVTKFPKSRGSKAKHKHHRNLNVSAHDTMVDPVGKPGSAERLAALAARYDRLKDSEQSPFAWEG
jgi:hypothetical protein